MQGVGHIDYDANIVNNKNTRDCNQLYIKMILKVDEKS
jgi:hypothetical protein